MIASQFSELNDRIFPKLQNLVEKERGERNGRKQRTYLHKTMLSRLYSPDQTWNTASVDTRYVMADTISMNSPLPIKKRDSIASASGKLPKVGFARTMEESDINAINIMKAQNDQWKQVAAKLSADPVFCSIGLDEANEFNFLTALCEGIVAVKDDNNTGTALRINFGYLEKNGFGVETPGELTLDDIERVLDAASVAGDVITTIVIDAQRYKSLRNTRGAKELVASYNGQTFDSNTTLPVPSQSKFNEAFKDQYGDIDFLVINRSCIFEKNGKQKSVKPWNTNRVVYLTTTMVGKLVWGTLAEKTAPVEGVNYQTVDEYKLISKFRTTNPLTETTAGQMMALTVIEGVDQIYYQDITEAQVVDETEEAKDTSDVKVTVWGTTYKKPEFIAALKAYVPGIKSNASDAAVIKAVNSLSKADEAALKADVEVHKAPTASE